MKRIKERWVVKVGSSLISGNDEGINKLFILNLVSQVNYLLNHNIEIIIISSGAVAKGMHELKLSERPSSLHLLQAAAAVGQLGLVNCYQKAFNEFKLKAAQVLISHDDIANRERYLNARRSLQTLIALGVIPIVNENDSVSTEEITFGDNDMLAGALSGLVSADKLIILTDQQGVCDSDPKENKSADLIPLIDLDQDKENIDKLMEGTSGILGRGGIKTKIKACSLALEFGAKTLIADGREEDTLISILKGHKIGTSLISQRAILPSRKQWIASQGSPSGNLTLDEGAVEAISNRGGSLLPVGVKEVNGDFARGSLLICLDTIGNEVARGLSNFSSEELLKIRGKRSKEVLEELGYPTDEEVIHRDNLILN